MKNKELCTVNRENLLDLVGKVVELYRIITKHALLIETKVKNCDRPRKTDMRKLEEDILQQSFDVFESVGCGFHNLMDEDEEMLYVDLLAKLQIDELTDTQQEKAPEEIKSLLNALAQIIFSDKPVTVSADIYINEKDKDDETDEN